MHRFRTLSIIHTQNAVFECIYDNNTASSGGHGSNTDGADTIYSSHITFRNWTVDNGDDSLSLKLIRRIFLSMIASSTMGSRLHAKGNTYNNTLHAAYFKTWTGEQVGYPPNGAGGGLGFAADLLFEDMQATNLRSAPFTISQCTTFSDTEGNCTSSKFEIYDISFKSIQGTTEGTADVASFQCSAVKPCRNIMITDIDLVVASNGTNVN
ncbi:uncharacterized protein TRUGW13939_07513 [Talaromyces rugulosus]|uniref:Pectate lyase superfamily protein domain-containing protein n=1 Tax=Talaromyces rugulosus TaxID=121627 RepID=A0A7H8R2W8_TALRU|nr:uncharacterized protein TRUGW13939_07513 [Talaromyces rugulosus]QKX60368.1 hypothetical protein TRUGW13939_07513 [Talaromyces rugulosus]